MFHTLPHKLPRTLGEAIAHIDPMTGERKADEPPLEAAMQSLISAIRLHAYLNVRWVDSPWFETAVMQAESALVEARKTRGVA
jgi:hypothetical protein